MVYFRPDRLEAERNRKGWTQEEIAKKIGVARSTYGNYENSNREPDFKTIRALSDLFEVSIDYLTGKSDYRNEQDLINKRSTNIPSNIDPEINELLIKLQQKGAELEATALLRTAAKMNKEQLKDILRVFDMIENDED